MLLNITVENYRSFNEPATLSLIAMNDKDDQGVNLNENNHNAIKITDKLFVNKTTVIYGATGSGKSNLLDALEVAGWLICSNSDRMARVIPFFDNSLNDFNITIELILNRIIYRVKVYHSHTEFETDLKERLVSIDEISEIREYFYQNMMQGKMYINRSIDNISILEIHIDLIASLLKQCGASFDKLYYDMWSKKYKVIYSNSCHYDFVDSESSQIIQLFKYFSVILNKLATGGFIAIDNFNLNNELMEAIIGLFHRNNTSNAQLIFTTHNTSLLKNDIFDKDQIYFTKKQKNLSTTLYSLYSFKEAIENDENEYIDLESYYLSGKFGATSMVGSLDTNV